MKHYKRMHSIPKRRRHHSGPPNIKLEKGHAALLKQRRMFVHKNPYAPGAHGSHAANADNIKIVSPDQDLTHPDKDGFTKRGRSRDAKLQTTRDAKGGVQKDAPSPDP